jgi:hypothetical protein
MSANAANWALVQLQFYAVNREPSLLQSSFGFALKQLRGCSAALIGGPEKSASKIEGA